MENRLLPEPRGDSPMRSVPEPQSVGPKTRVYALPLESTTEVTTAPRLA